MTSDIFSEDDKFDMDMWAGVHPIPPANTGQPKMRLSDPAYWMLFDDVESVPTVRRDGCYICEDDEYARMGLPICFPCFICGTHVPADAMVCDAGHTQPSDPEEEEHLRDLYGGAK